MVQAAWARGPGLLPVLRILSARIHRMCCCIGRLTPVPLDAVPMGSVSQLFRWCHLQMEVLSFHIKPRTTLLQNGTGFVNTTCQSSSTALVLWDWKPCGCCGAKWRLKRWLGEAAWQRGDRVWAGPRGPCAADAQRRLSQRFMCPGKALSTECVQTCPVRCCVSSGVVARHPHRVPAPSLHLKKQPSLLYSIQQNRSCLSGLS